MRECVHTERAEQLLEELYRLCQQPNFTVHTAKNMFGAEIEYIEASAFMNTLSKLSQASFDLMQWWEND